MKTVIIGTGSWGTALGQVLSDNGNDVILWGRNATEVDDINLNHKNSKYFNVKISDKLIATTDLSVCKEANLIILAIPSHALEAMLNNISQYIVKPIILNTAKGFHPISHKRMSQVIADTIDETKREAIVSLIGPSHAEEVILRQLTCINAVSDNDDAAKLIQKIFSNEYFRVYRNNDVVGAEIGVAIKNIMAIAAGCLEGIGQGDNARAALMTRGLAEMTRYGIFMGGKEETFLGLDGVGDLIVTCTSKHSRNYMAGLEIGQANSARTFMENNKKTVEGISACKVIYEESQKIGIEMPITTEVYHVLFEGKEPSNAITDLMTRKLKSE